MFRKGKKQAKAMAKPRITVGPFVRPFVRPFVCVCLDRNRILDLDPSRKGMRDNQKMGNTATM